MTFTVAYFAITAALCYLTYHLTMWHWRRRHLYKMASKFEGPSTLPIIGNAHLFIGNNEQLLSKLNDLGDSYPSLYRLWLGPILIFVATDPEHIKMICNNPKTLGKGKFFSDYCRSGLGEGILIAPVPKWKVHRKLIQPTFNSKILDSFVPIFSAQLKILTEQMEPNSGGPEFEISDMVSKCILDMLCETAMGIKVKAQTDKNCYIRDALQEAMTCIFKRMASPWLHPDFIFNKTQIGRDQNKILKYLHGFTANVIQLKRKQLHERHSQPATADDEYDARKPGSRTNGFLDHFLTVSNESASLSDEELREEVSTILAAGVDTNSFTTSHVMLMLASHPDVQDKVYQELFDIYGEADIEERPVTSKDLPRMKYLDCVIRETLRIFPAVPFIVRDVTDDLEIGEYTLPKGSTVAFGILTLHRNEKYWPDPLKFNPDRFLPEEIAKRHLYAFMAFSRGRRNCIGLKYAMMTMQTLIATILRKFVLKIDNAIPVKDIRFKMDMTLKPVNPIKVRIERRTGN